MNKDILVEDRSKLKIDEMVRLNKYEFEQSDKIPLIIVADNIRSMNNIGSLFRTADTFRLEKIILCGISPCPPHNEIHKTALGAEDVVEWQIEENTLVAVEKLQQQGYKALCLEQTKSSTLLNQFESIHNDKYCLIIGNEVFGVSQEVIDIADNILEIPQLGTKHSLNVSVATGITVWHLIQPFIKMYHYDGK